MSLTPGARLGSYEVLAKLGEGGMGEVYRARDTRLNRDVALKILPAAFTADPERLARFEREAQVLASLQHANIAAIYGIEDSGSVRALVLELVEGPTLADRIAAGPIPLAEALPIGRQIADALGAAHDAGVIHRDLKPANIKVRHDGTVKVLDFGLAKIAEVTEGSGGTERRSAENSPTLTARGTQMGMVIGTAAYMAPEQARGKPVDRRADLWAFGVVLYEMLTGRRAFDGREVTDVLASVIKDAPSLDALPADVPPGVRRLLRRTLEKDRARRLDSMAAARLELDDAERAESGTPPAAPRSRTGLLAIIAVLAVASAGVAGMAVWSAMQPTRPEVRRFTITPDAGAEPVIETNHNDVAITPDGRQIIYFSRPAQNQFVVRRLDRFESVIHANAGFDARGPVVSANGQWLVFQTGLPIGTDSQLTRMPIEGGSPTPVCKFDGNLRGATWGADETILFGSTSTETGILRVPASGGTAEVLTTPSTNEGEVDHFWPQFLPGGRHALFAIMRADRSFDVALLSLDSKTWRVLVKNGTSPRYAPTGHLVYGSGSALMAVPFDLDRLEVRGDPIEVLSGILTKEAGAADFALSADGTLVYLAGAVPNLDRRLAWRDADGKETALATAPANFNDVRVSPDTKFAVAVVGQAASFELWLVDLAREVSSRITAPEYRAGFPVWSRDSRQIAFWSPGRVGTNEPGGIFRIAASGTTQPERLTTAAGGNRHTPTSFTLDDKELLFSDIGQTSADVMRLSLDASRTITPVLSGPDVEAQATLSPDGRWLAYMQIESRSQIFIRPYPDVNQIRIPVTTDGGWEPVWSADGNALYFRDRNLTAEYVVDIKTAGNTVSASTPRRFTSMRDQSNAFYNVAMPPVGRRVLTTQRASAGATRPPEYRVILNWFEELKKLTARQ
jgi:serine/threonine-protein kinase